VRAASRARAARRAPRARAAARVLLALTLAPRSLPPPARPPRRAGNILLSADGRVAIADFGVAGWMSEAGDRSTKGPCKTFVGTPCWMAPEVMEQTRGYNEKADIWSVGITALELFKGYAPYAKLPPMQVLIKTIREPPPTLRAYGDEKTPGLPAATDRFQKFVARCLQKDPRDRCVAAEAAAARARTGVHVPHRATRPRPAPPRPAPPRLKQAVCARAAL
jgi:serine/threonine protein kinase